MKKIKANIDSTSEYIHLLNGLFDLTDSEINVLSAFVDLHIKLNESEVDINPFSTQGKKKVAKELNKKDFNTLNTYIKRLKDKHAIMPIQDGYIIHNILIPTNKIEITLTYE